MTAQRLRTLTPAPYRRARLRSAGRGASIQYGAMSRTAWPRRSISRCEKGSA